MKTWDRGKKRLTEKEKEASIKWQHERVNIIAMRPYMDVVFDTERRDLVYNLFHTRCYYFRDLITQKKMKKALSLLKPTK